MSERVLVVDDEEVLRGNLVRFLTRRSLSVDSAASAEEALRLFDDGDYAVVLTDLKMPGMGGQALLQRLREERPDVQIMVMTAHASVESAGGALRLGAQDYLLKPLSLQEVGQKVHRLLRTRELVRENQRLRRELQAGFDVEGMVAEDPAMRGVLDLIGRAAASRSSVLVEGESGTGKELVARALHEHAPWSAKPFIAVNLAAQPRDLVDGTLFGHERGAFTGASGRREGVFRAVRGGTVFLDELAELPAGVQVKLLRLLENREVLPLGADRAVPVDFRLVCATNRPLEAEVEAGRFREDLLYRIDVVRIRLPPLRERRRDIPPLVRRFVDRHSQALGRRPPQVSSAAMRRLQSYDWPGNVRELSNAIERAVLLGDPESVGVEDLVLRGSPGPETDDLKTVLEDCERRHIDAVLAACGGDKPMAARRLGIHLATLYRRLEKLGGETGTA